MKRLISLALCAVLMLAVSAPASGADDIFLVGINDSFPFELSSATMPVYYSGSLYVPYTVFAHSDLGVLTSYNSTDMILTLYNATTLYINQRRLVFNIESGTVFDENETESDVAALYRSGMVFVPAAFVSAHFGFGCSMLESSGGCGIVRITNGSQVYQDDAYFIQKAENLITRLVTQYENAGSIQSSPQPQSPSSGQSSAVTHPPTASPEPSPEVTPPEDEPQEYPQQLALAFSGTEEFLAASLEFVESSGVSGAFYFKADQLSSCGDLLRNIYSGGHEIGLVCDGGDVTGANELLYVITGFKTRLLLGDGSVPAPEGYVLSTGLTASQLSELRHISQPKLLCYDGENAEQAQAAFSDLQESDPDMTLLNVSESMLALTDFYSPSPSDNNEDISN